MEGFWGEGGIYLYFQLQIVFIVCNALAYSYSTLPGPGTRLELMDSNILCRNVRTGLR